MSGSRQVGKTTLLKQIICKLIKRDGLDPNQIYYLPCDTIENFKQLIFEIEQFRQSIDPEKAFVLFLDEVNFVKEWTRAIKSFADAGLFSAGSVLITGSDTALLKSAMMEFPAGAARLRIRIFISFRFPSASMFHSPILVYTLLSRASVRTFLIVWRSLYRN